MPPLITVKHLAIAGILAQISFELYAWFLSPVLFGPVLKPANLVMGFGAYTQSSFVSHVGMTVIIALIWQWLAKRRGQSMEQPA